MSFNRSIVLLLSSLSLSISAFACPQCSGTWVQVSKDTKSAPGTGGIGGTFTADGVTLQCQKPVATTGTGSTTTSGSTSTSNSGATSTSGASATGGKSSSTADGGSATGGSVGPIKITAGGATNSGNSTNTNTANGGAGGTGGQGGVGEGGAGGTASQQQSNTSTNNNASSATSNGDNSNNSTTTINEAKIPVNTAYAPTALPTMNCFKGFGAGVQASQFGFSLGGGKVDENCERLEVARSFGIAGSWEAYCRVMITNKYAKEAHVTFEDCMKRVTEVPAPAPVAVQQPVQVPTPQVIVLPVQTVAAPPPISAPVPASVPAAETALDHPQLIGVCTFLDDGTHTCQVNGKPVTTVTHSGVEVSQICAQMLAAAAQELRDHPKDYLVIVGDHNSIETSNLAVLRAQNVVHRLITQEHVDENRISVRPGGSGKRAVQLWLEPPFTVNATAAGN